MPVMIYLGAMNVKMIGRIANNMPVAIVTR